LTEAFVIFSQDIPSQSLGFIDSQASVLDISVAGFDLAIHQSRGLLTSDRKEGTTGAGMWLCGLGRYLRHYGTSSIALQDVGTYDLK
jgi:hypothetical protein